MGGKIMAYKPPRTSSGSFGEKGAALVQIKKDKGLLHVAFRNGGEHTLKLDKCPPQLTQGRWMINLNGDETEVFSFYPYAGSFQGRVLKFQAKEGEPPQFWESGGKFPDWMFTVVFEITQPEKFKGIEVPYFLRNRFDEVQADDGKLLVGIKQGKHGDNLNKFLTLTGAWNRGPVPWKSNVLPLFEKRILHENVEFGFAIENGYVSGVFSLSSSDSLEWDGE